MVLTSDNLTSFHLPLPSITQSRENEIIDQGPQVLQLVSMGWPISCDRCRLLRWKLFDFLWNIIPFSLPTHRRPRLLMSRPKDRRRSRFESESIDPTNGSASAGYTREWKIINRRWRGRPGSEGDSSDAWDEENRGIAQYSSWKGTAVPRQSLISYLEVVAD
jgi:hypothetical protein